MHKFVHHYLLEATGGHLTIENDPDHEAIDVAWLPLREAHEHLTFPNERRIARQAWAAPGRGRVMHRASVCRVLAAVALALPAWARTVRARREPSHRRCRDVRTLALQPVVTPAVARPARTSSSPARCTTTAAPPWTARPWRWSCPPARPSSGPPAKRSTPGQQPPDRRRAPSSARPGCRPPWRPATPRPSRSRCRDWRPLGRAAYGAMPLSVQTGTDERADLRRVPADQAVRADVDQLGRAAHPRPRPGPLRRPRRRAARPPGPRPSRTARGSTGSSTPPRTRR